MAASCRGMAARYRRAMRAVRALAAALVLAACGSDPTLPFGEPPALPGATPEPASPVDEALRGGPAARQVRRIAGMIQKRYGLVEIWRADAHRRGRLVVYAVRMRLDERSDHPDLDDWSAHVRRAARDQREAAVTMAKETVVRLPTVRLVSIYQDELLQPFWSRRQIRGMDEPRRYRTFEAWQRLVLSAAILPGRPGP
jgi:hypothetical protein